MAHSLVEASALTGIHHRTLYNIADGTMVQPEKHLLKLLDLPAFADAFMSIRGHACTYVGNESGCENEAIASCMEALGEAAPMIGKPIGEPQKKRLADRMAVVKRKAQAFLHRFSRERMERAGA